MPTFKVTFTDLLGDDTESIFGDVVVRVNPNFAAAMHIDTDESNAALCKPGSMGVIL